MEDLQFTNLPVTGFFANHELATIVDFKTEGNHHSLLKKLLEKASQSPQGEATTTTMACKVELYDNLGKITFTTEKWFVDLAAALYNDSDDQEAKICVSLSKDHSTIFESRLNFSKDNLGNFEVVPLIFTDQERLEERQGFRNQYVPEGNRNVPCTAVTMDLDFVFTRVTNLSKP